MATSPTRALLTTAALLGIFLAGGLIGGILVVHAGKSRWERFEKVRQEELQQREQEQQKLVALIEQLRTEQQAQQKQLQQWQHAQSQRRPSPERFGPQLMRRFAAQVQATPEQLDKIRPLVTQAAEDLRRLQRETTHTTEGVLEHLEDQIATILTPAQRDQFNGLVQKWRAAFQKYNTEMQKRQAEARQSEGQHRPPAPPAPSGVPPAPAAAPATP